MLNCKNCNQPFLITDADKTFYAKIDVPAPTRCPDCRQQRRLTWANELFLYQRKSSLTGKDIISMYNPNLSLKVYSVPEWWSDDWEGLDYGQDYLPNTSFIEQFMALKSNVPHAALSIGSAGVTNSDFVNYCGHLKNCYLVFDSDNCEDCYYSGTLTDSRDSIDCMKSRNCELCYECIDCYKCFNLKYSQDCLECSQSYFLKNCSGCIDCFRCVNLHNQKYCWGNEQLSSAEYQERLSQVDFGSRSVIQAGCEQLNLLMLQHPHKYLHGIKNDGCTGDYLYNAAETFDSYDCRDVQNCHYCYSIPLSAKDLYDTFQWGDNCELLYENVEVGDSDYNCKFCLTCAPHCQNLEYCFSCRSCKNCFGCASLKNKEFCILNKQYNEKDYFVLKEIIIDRMKRDGEYGEFFPARFSPHGYNETDAIFYYPLAREEAIRQGFKWYDQPKKEMTHQVVPPDTIQAVTEGTLSEVFSCSCGRSFKIIPQEFSFYKKLNIPLPNQCYFCRHIARLNKRNPQKLFLRHCDKCQKDMRTTYAPDRPEKVYCEECYQKEIY
ncbi:zinc-ribbon domain containing protein [Candidatus Falkowbacteria bacterium]|nr:zinc-ribbon domain containing protein [Candidatus Falkowbacteria bacterium]